MKVAFCMYAMNLRKNLIAFFLFMTTILPGFSLPIIPSNSVILDDEVGGAFDEFFNDLLQASGKKAAGKQKASFVPKVILLSNSSVNAASGPGGEFVIFSGLFRMCDNVEEFLGVIAHEIAHGKGIHSVQAAMGEDKAFLTAAVAFALGGVAALAAKDASPLIAGLTGGQTAYIGTAMKNMQHLEKAADAEAIHILAKAGIPPTGLLTFLQKLQKAYGTPDLNPYFMDHPLTEDRIQAVQKDVQEADQKFPGGNWPKKAHYTKLFNRIRAKILGFTMDPTQAIKLFDGSTPNDHYARSVAYGRMPSQTSKALNELNHILKDEPNNPYILELKSQLLMDAGKSDEAVETLTRAVKEKPKNGKEAVYLKLSLAHLLVEQQKNTKDAIHYLNQIILHDHNNHFAWHLLGKAHMINGQEAHALWANAEADAIRDDKNASKAKLKNARNKAKGDKILLQKIGDLERSL